MLVCRPPRPWSGLSENPKCLLFCPILALYIVLAAMLVFLITDAKVRAWIAGPLSRQKRHSEHLEHGNREKQESHEVS